MLVLRNPARFSLHPRLPIALDQLVDGGAVGCRHPTRQSGQTNGMAKVIAVRAGTPGLQRGVRDDLFRSRFGLFEFVPARFDVAEQVKIAANYLPALGEGGKCM